MPSSPSPKPREEIAYAELHPYLNPLHPINIHREPGDHIPEGVLNVKPVKHMKVIWSEEKKSENEAEEDEWEEEKTWKRPEAYIRMLRKNHIDIIVCCDKKSHGQVIKLLRIVITYT